MDNSSNENKYKFKLIFELSNPEEFTLWLGREGRNYSFPSITSYPNIAQFPSITSYSNIAQFPSITSYPNIAQFPSITSYSNIAQKSENERQN